MKIVIDLAGASPEQLEKFSDGALPETLDAIRLAVGDATATIEVRQPGVGMRLHAVQTLDDFNDFPREVMRKFDPLTNNAHVDEIAVRLNPRSD